MSTVHVLQESLEKAIDSVFTAQVIAKPKTGFSEFEIEIRFGTVKVNDEVQFGTSIFVEHEYTNAFMVFGTRKFFDTNVGDAVFYQSFQRLTQDMPHLCHTISIIENTWTTSTARERITWDINDNVVFITKEPLVEHIDLLPMSICKRNIQSQTSTEYSPLALRLAASHEKPSEHTIEIPKPLNARFRERRSVYLYDTTGLTSKQHNHWLLYTDISEDAAKILPRNHWRIDFSRVCEFGCETFHIELELDFSNAWETANSEYKRFGYPGNNQLQYFKFRVLRTLAECIYRVHYAIDPATPSNWLNKT